MSRELRLMLQQLGADPVQATQALSTLDELSGLARRAKPC